MVLAAGRYKVNWLCGFCLIYKNLTFGDVINGTFVFVDKIRHDAPQHCSIDIQGKK
jgi:hypothetical protein